MKNAKFILPVLAAIFAVAGVFATGSSRLTLLEAVTATQANCAQHGTCDQGPGACELTFNTSIKFYTIVGGEPTTCSTQSTGKFCN